MDSGTSILVVPGDLPCVVLLCFYSHSDNRKPLGPLFQDFCRQPGLQQSEQHARHGFQARRQDLQADSPAVCSQARKPVPARCSERRRPAAGELMTFYCGVHLSSFGFYRCSFLGESPSVFVSRSLDLVSLICVLVALPWHSRFVPKLFSLCLSSASAFFVDLSHACVSLVVTSDTFIRAWTTTFDKANARVGFAPSIAGVQ